mmetsp:Transcript_47303/g.109472  ORF Transcript_47303/g.109472 Transcript_47303/m.109472 type:complete len:110 (+) Transcript_47303:311-640(+)
MRKAFHLPASTDGTLVIRTASTAAQHLGIQETGDYDDDSTARAQSMWSNWPAEQQRVLPSKNREFAGHLLASHTMPAAAERSVWTMSLQSNGRALKSVAVRTVRLLAAL